MKVWRVDDYTDTLLEVSDASYRFARYFHTREAAVAFMVERAEKAVADADREAHNARRRLANVRKKFAPVISEGAVGG